MSNINSFIKKNNGRFINVNKSLFIKQPTSQVIPFGVERHLVDDYIGLNIAVKFTDIEGNLYLSTRQLIDLFDVSDKHITHHLNNIYGEFLDRNGIFTVNEVRSQGGEKVPPLGLIIYELSVVYPSLPGRGGGGNQQVLFYHHDMIVELAGRLNNNRARSISQYVKNIVHDYHKTGVVVNTSMFDNAEQVHKVVSLKIGNLTPGRINNREYLKSKFISVISQASDFHVWKNNNQIGKIAGLLMNSFHVGNTGETAAGLVYSRCNPNLPECGMTSYYGVRGPTKNDSGIGLNYYKIFEETRFFSLMLFVFSSLELFIEVNKGTEVVVPVDNMYSINYNQKSDLSVSDLLRFTDYVITKFALLNNLNLNYYGENFRDYKLTTKPIVNEYIRSGYAKKLAIEKLEIYRLNLSNKQCVTYDDIIELSRLEDNYSYAIVEENEYVNASASLIVDSIDNPSSSGFTFM